MASGKARGIKRSSATSSYSSATTIVIFVGLSVLGLWLLTSNSFAPPQSSTTKTPTRIASTGHTHHSNELPQTHHNQDDPSYISDPSKGERPNDDKADETVEIETETKIENEEIQTDGGVKTEATLPDQVDHQDTKGSQENNVAEEQEKQAALETQTSEESSMTQKQHAEEITEENPHSETKVETNDPESSGNHGVEVITTEGGSLTQSSETTQNQITDEDQQRRIDEHQQQEDEQNQQRQQEAQSKDPNGATSHDQIQHDEASLHSHQTGSSSQETDEPNAHAENQETKHDSLGEDRNKASLSQKMNEEKTNNGDEASTSNGDNSEIPKESTESKKSWSTQANQSENQKERRKTGSNDQESSNHGYTWLLCNVTADADYIPCLDNEKVIANIHKRTHHEHRERHCPEDPPTCLVPLPHGYKRRIEWPQSRDKIWYNNIPHTSLAEYKGHQNWVKVTGEFLSFPGGGTQFIHGALHYIDFIREAVPDIAWGKHTRVVLDVGCGVASFGGYLFDRDVLTMSFAPKDEHEAQVQFALERGIPAISAVMGSQRLPFPSRVFDVVHCARCRVPWHADG